MCSHVFHDAKAVLIALTTKSGDAENRSPASITEAQVMAQRKLTVTVEAITVGVAFRRIVLRSPERLSKETMDKGDSLKGRDYRKSRFGTSLPPDFSVIKP